MTFREVPSKVDFVAQERDVLDMWHRTDAFGRLRELRQDAPK